MFFRRPCEITAVILTTGELTTQRAVDSVRRQTIPVNEIIVRDVRPFHRALNAGAAQVATPFFVQVDADMILDPGCVATLRAAMKADVGISVGRLRDQLMQQVVGIKMFRTACFEIAQFRDSISPDTDFVDDIEREGWRTVYVGKRGRFAIAPWKALGEHSPDYSPAYTYRKYLMEGRRYRYRSSVGGLRGHLSQLGTSQHPSALAAQVALARGFFRELQRDTLGREEGDDEFELLRQFLAIADLRGPTSAIGTIIESHEMSLADRFRFYFGIGRAAFKAADPSTFLRHMAHLNGEVENGWISRLALCHGLLETSTSEATLDAHLAVILNFLPAQSSMHPTRPARAVSFTQPGLDIDDAKSYAAAAGLTHFVIAPPAGVERGLSVHNRSSDHRTAENVVTLIDANGRPRIQLPFKMFGNVICADPERSTGFFWCYDLLKAGYLFAHIPSRFGTHRTFVPTLIARSALGRFTWKWKAPRSAALFRMAKRRKLKYVPDTRSILMVTENLGRGGSERQMLTLVRGLLHKGYKVHLLSLSQLEANVPSFEQEFSKIGISTMYAGGSAIEIAQTATSVPNSADYAALPTDIRNRILAVKAAIDLCRPEVLHAWLDWPGVVSGLAASMAGTPRCVIQQGSISPARRRLGSAELLRLVHRALRRNPAVTLINNSAAGARDNERWIGLRPRRIGVLHNGFEPGSSRVADPTRVHRFRQNLGLPDQAQVVGTVMRFVPEKDPALWIDTAAEIARTRSNVYFIIAGFGPLEDTIKLRIDALGLRDRIALAGPIDDPGLVYCSTDVVLLTSAVEGLPNVMIEAQAVGRPVVAPDVGGTCEAVAEGLTGTIVRPRAAKFLARATIALLENDEWRESVRTSGPAFVASRFSIDRMIDETLAVYRIGG
jgi:glycosyltransferase involved in cell wall biosynthesis